MPRNLEVILDANPSGGCGCNCGCGGASKVEDLNDLVEELKGYNFGTDLDIDVLEINGLNTDLQVEKINELLNNTNASFRVNEETIEEALSSILPLIVLDGDILTAYGVPSLHDVVTEVEKKL